MGSLISVLDFGGFKKLVAWFVFKLSGKQVHVLIEIVVSIDTGFRQRIWNSTLGLSIKVIVSSICEYMEEGLVNELTCYINICTLDLAVCVSFPKLLLRMGKQLQSFCHVECFTLMCSDFP